MSACHSDQAARGRTPELDAGQFELDPNLTELINTPNQFGGRSVLARFLEVDKDNTVHTPAQLAANGRFEPLRLSRRLLHLRKRSHEKVKTFPRGRRAGGADGGGRPSSARFAVGCHRFHCRHEKDTGKREGVTTQEAQRIKDLERENRELRQANEILRKASAYFAQAELDRRFKP
jgi:hypothetical protein